MRFIDYKKFLEEHEDFYLYKAVAVNEVDCFRDYFELNWTDDEFSRVCEFVYDWTQNTEATAAEVARIVCRGLRDGDITIADMDEYTEDNDWQSVAEQWLNNQF